MVLSQIIEMHEKDPSQMSERHEMCPSAAEFKKRSGRRIERRNEKEE
jgi:hypothetical protein